MTRRRACTVRVNMFVFLLNMLVLLPSFGRTQTEGDSNRIRQVDFYNFTYQPYCGGDKLDEPVQVKQGAFERSFLGQEDFIKFQISEIIFGDLTGDKRNEAVVVTRCSTGGTATFSEGFTYTMQNGKVRLLARLKGGDVADGGVGKVQIKDGLLKVERSAPTNQAAHCCPDYVATTTYRWNGHDLVQVGLTERRRIDRANDKKKD